MTDLYHTRQGIKHTGKRASLEIKRRELNLSATSVVAENNAASIVKKKQSMKTIKNRNINNTNLYEIYNSKQNVGR